MTINQPIEIEIAKCGRATATNGTPVDFTQGLLEEVADSYNPSVYQAPLIITHDTKGMADKDLAASPFAYGRPDYLVVVGDRLKAVFTGKNKIAPEVITWFKNGNLLSVSPSFYPPNSPFNPTPGKFSLRHIAMLGKEPPSFKGLTPIEFSETGDFLDFAIAPDDALNFSCACEMQEPALADAIQRVREFLIAEKGMETADQVLPSSLVQRIRNEAAIGDASEDEEEYEETEESEGCDLCGEPYPSEYPTPTHFYSYGESTMQTKTHTKTKAQKARVIQEPLYEDTTVLEGDEYEQYDDPDEMEDEEEVEEMPPTKGKKQMPSSTKDFSENLRALQDQLNRLQLDFSERESYLRNQNEYLNQLVVDQQLDLLANQSEVEAIKQDFAEKEEALIRSQITDFVEQLESDGKVPASLTGDYALSFSEDDEELSFAEALYRIHQADPAAFDVLEQFLAGLPSFSDRTPVNFGEYDGDDTPYVPATSPVQALGLKIPTNSRLSDQQQEQLQACLDYAEANGLDYRDPQQKQIILKAVFG